MGRAEDFSKYSTEEKWDSINTSMRVLQQEETAFELRRRLNTHHHPKQIQEETRRFRMDQWIKWCEVKDLYAEHRDELADTLGDESYQTCRSILERIFTNELDDALRKTLEE